jgi:hypothetical protein
MASRAADAAAEIEQGLATLEPGRLRQCGGRDDAAGVELIERRLDPIEKARPIILGANAIGTVGHGRIPSAGRSGVAKAPDRRLDAGLMEGESSDGSDAQGGRQLLFTMGRRLFACSSRQRSSPIDKLGWARVETPSADPIGRSCSLAGFSRRSGAVVEQENHQFGRAPVWNRRQGRACAA